MKKKGRRDETYIWEQIAKYAENAVKEEGENFYDVMEKIIQYETRRIASIFTRTMQKCIKRK